MAARIIGLDELNRALAEIAANVKDYDLVTIPLVEGLRKFAHVQTGRMKGAIYRESNVAGSSAPYAGFEEERGGDHAFGTLAIEDFDIEAYADAIVRPF